MTTNPFKDETVLISKFTDRVEEFTLDLENTPWLHKIMDKITADFDKTEFPENCEKLEVKVKYKRDLEDIYGEYFSISGQITGNYYANCVRCLINVPMKFKTDFKGAYINQHFEKDEEYAELDEIYIDGDTADLHFHNRGKANIADIIAEATFLAIDHYPIHDAECKGLCYTCGIDLNKGTCNHKN